MWADIAENMIAAITAEPKQLKLMWDNFPLGVLVTNILGEVIYYNKAHAKIDGLDQAEVIGQKEINVLIPISGPNIMNVAQKIAQPILGYIFPYRTFKGKIVNAAYWVFPIFKSKKVVASVCFTQPLLGEMVSQGKAYETPPIQWPGRMPINMPTKKIVGENKTFKKAIALAKSSSNNPFSILIAGETGSGKEMFAKLIHQSSKRRNRPYLAINCAAIPENLLEGLLFGTTKGSFTGAIDRAGLFEEAQGGTIYLDEIDSMPLDLQPKLLRVLQEMRISRVGSAKEISLDLKVISSIGSNPQKALKDGMLRADLFYRLAVVVVDVPPLRERLDDLENLSDYFICKYNNILGKSAIKLDNQLLKILLTYSWPGNVRELEHLIAGAINIVDDENFISYEHIPEHYRQAFSAIKETDHHKADLKTTVHEAELSIPSHNIAVKHLVVEHHKICDVLRETKGNISKAAQKMGISRQLLNYRMMKHGVSRHDFK